MGKTLIRLQNQRLALRADSGLAIGTIYPISSKRNLMGRSVDVEVPVDDSKVSRVHASIDEQNGFHYLVDLGSTNGSYVNGERVQNMVRIKAGDRLRLGSTVFVVEFLDHAKTLCGKTWKEPTRAILFGEEERAKQCARLEENEMQSDLMLDRVKGVSSGMILKFNESQRKFFEKNGRWFSAITVIVLIAAAIASTFRHGV